MKKKYYEILEIESSSTQDDIRKAYKKLALQGHPDKGSTKPEGERKAAEEKFKEIGEAYAVLSDEQKRKLYDNNREGKKFTNVPTSATKDDEGEQEKKGREERSNRRRIAKEQRQVREQIIGHFSRNEVRNEELAPEWQNWEEQLIKITDAYTMGTFVFKIREQVEMIGKRKKEEKAVKKLAEQLWHLNIESWENIHPKFTSKLQKEGEDGGFTHEQCRGWIKIGLKVNDAGFAYGLEYVIKVDIETAKEQFIHDASVGVLREQYQKYQNEFRANIVNISSNKP